MSSFKEQHELGNEEGKKKRQQEQHEDKLKVFCSNKNCLQQHILVTNAQWVCFRRRKY